MNKLLLIIQREYLTRVTRPTFIIATIITPLAFVLFFVIAALILSYQSDDKKKIAVIDEAGILQGDIKDQKNLYFKLEKRSLETLRKNFKATGYDAVLVIPPQKDLLSKSETIFYYSAEQPTIDVEILLTERVSDALREYKINRLQLDRRQLEALDTKIALEPEPIEPGGADATRFTSAVAAGIGGIMGFIMYFTVFIYGVMVMRSVMEEKTNRIVEVMMSTIRPFQLMLGKIIGVGLVGLTQVAIWAIMIPVLMFTAQTVMGIEPPAGGVGAAGLDQVEAQDKIFLALQEIGNINWLLIFPLFVIYFLGGYFLYASLFAAVGSAMGDDLGEGQSLTVPITIPVVLALYIMMQAVQAPNSSLSVFASIFPLFSPIVMPARLAFGIPTWQIVVSVIVLVATSLFFVWLSGRIYRVGILLYGKKVNLLQFSRWIFVRD